MKIDKLKELIKEAVREVLNEELGSMRKYADAPAPIKTQPTTPKAPQAEAIQNILKETAASGEWRTALNMNSGHIQQPLTGGSVDLANGSLPQGEVSVDAIKRLMTAGK